MMFYTVFSDSSIQPFNPSGILTWAFIVKVKGQIVHQDTEISGYGLGMTNNLGETQAVLAAMLWLTSLPEDKKYPVFLYSDSKLIVDQSSGRSECHAGNLIPLQKLIQRAKKTYPRTITFRWIPRENNTEADALSRSLYTEEMLEIAKRRKLDFIHGGDLPF
jgi:ribonuclease HI